MSGGKRRRSAAGKCFTNARVHVKKNWDVVEAWKFAIGRRKSLTKQILRCGHFLELSATFGGLHQWVGFAQLSLVITWPKYGISVTWQQVVIYGGEIITNVSFPGWSTAPSPWQLSERRPLMKASKMRLKAPENVQYLRSCGELEGKSDTTRARVHAARSCSQSAYSLA